MLVDELHNLPRIESLGFAKVYEEPLVSFLGTVLRSAVASVAVFAAACLAVS